MQEYLPAIRLGRPLKNPTPELISQFVQYMSEGKSQAQAMKLCDIRSYDLLKRWQIDFPEFKEAVEYGKILYQAYMEEVGIQGMTGQIERFNAATYIFLMCNQHKDHYKQQNTGVNVQVNNVTPFAEIPQDELERKAIELSQKIVEKKLLENKNE